MSLKGGKYNNHNRSNKHNHKRIPNNPANVDIILESGKPEPQSGNEPGSLNAINDILLSRIIELERKYEEERASNEELRSRVTEMERAQDQYVVKYNTKIEELMEMIDQIYDEIYKLVVLFNLNEIVEDNMPFHQGLYQQTRTYKVI